jgi:hypothetical protein
MGKSRRAAPRFRARASVWRAAHRPGDVDGEPVGVEEWNLSATADAERGRPVGEKIPANGKPASRSAIWYS